jgi:hypothetical protein
MADGIFTVKKVREFPVLSRDVTTKLSLGGNNDVITELFLPRGSLVRDIPAGDRKLVNLFYGVESFSLLIFYGEVKSCQMTPISAIAISLDSTFKAEEFLLNSD